MWLEVDAAAFDIVAYMVAVFFGGEPRDSEFAAVDAQPRNVHGFRRCGICDLNDLLKVFVGLRLARALEVTLRQTRDRFTAGEVTRTDVAQAESRLSGGRSQLSLAESNYVTAQAQYLQVIGVPPPARPAPAPPVDRLSPRTLDGAIAQWAHRASFDHDRDV